MGIPVEDLTTSWEYEIPIEFWIHLIILRLIDLSIVLVRMTKSVKLIQGILNISGQSARTQTPQWNLLLSLLLISHNWLSYRTSFVLFYPWVSSSLLCFPACFRQNKNEAKLFSQPAGKASEGSAKEVQTSTLSKPEPLLPFTTSTNFH